MSKLRIVRNLLNRTVSLGAIAAFQTAFFSWTMLSRPAHAGNFNQFDICTAELLNSGILPSQASVACANALEPKDLSLCVFKLNYATPVTPEDALETCFRVRRPLDFANCVFDIDKATENFNIDPNSIVDHCRRSLLPNDFSECVVGLSQQVDLNPTTLMNTCINAEDFPRQLFP